MKKTVSKDGFTMVEVALVLAVAGLILLLALWVWPTVQRIQKDAKRRDDVGELMTAIQKYQNNSRGASPTTTSTLTTVSWNDAWEGGTKPSEGTWESLYYSFLGKDFEDPNGYKYNIAVRMCGAKAGMECDGEINAVEEKSFQDNNYTMYVAVGAMCDGSKAVGSSNPKRVAAVYRMEGAGAYCMNTQ